MMFLKINSYPKICYVVQGGCKSLLVSCALIFIIHPLAFTGSADRTVKFWDLETFELIGSAGPEVVPLVFDTMVESLRRVRDLC